MQPIRILTALALAASPMGAQTLKGSPASVDKMYNTAHARDLQFFFTKADIYEAARTGELKMLSKTENVDLERIEFPFVLPNTARFVDSLAAKFRAACPGERLTVTSGARPLDKQPRNASPKTVHPTGMAVDFRKPRTPACLTWMRTNLLALENAGVVEATEEMHPPHFHVAVLYQPPERHIQMAAGEVGIAPLAKPGANPDAKPAAKPATKHARKHHRSTHKP